MKNLYTICLLLFCYSASSQYIEITPQHQYDSYFQEAYKTYDQIPEGILEAISYTQTHMQNINPEDMEPSCSGMPSYHGVMGLVIDGKGWFNNNMDLVLRYSDKSLSDLNNPRSQILAYAKTYQAIMHKHGIHTKDIKNQIIVLNELTEIPNDGSIGSDFAFDSYLYNLFAHLNDNQFQSAYNLPQYNIDMGSIFGNENYEILSSSYVVASNDHVASREGCTYKGNFARNSMTCSDTTIPTIFVAADPSNYSSRSGTAISALTIHTMQGTYAGAISWFQNPAANVSAHYNFRSSDGQITQMVCEADKAWHVGSENPYTIGFEHDGYVTDATWYTNVMYNASANLAADIANRYSIPTVRTHDRNGDNGIVPISTNCYKIKGHQHYPNQSHTDPGPNWDWNRYYDLLNPESSTPSNTFTNCSGSFQDGGGAANYSNDVRSFYLIEPTGATSVTLSFTSFNLETNYDYLYVYDGNSFNDELIATLNGTSIPPSITGESGSLFLEFRTDCATTTSGWDAAWTCNTAAPTCGTPSNVSHTNVSPNDVSVSWDAVAGATSYSIRLKGNLDNAWTYFTTTDTNYQLEELLLNGNYTWGVSAICGGNQSPYNGDNFDNVGNLSGANTATNCTGTFIDNGGTIGTYLHNEDWTLTIAPPGASSINLVFSSFTLEALGGSGQIYDYMKFYDGPSTSSPQIGGTYTASNSPGTITSTGGSLTIRFHSDNATFAAGWEASWTCVSGTPTLPTLQNPIVMGDATGVFNGNLDCGLTYHNFYDSGNSAANYQNNESFIQTICNPDPSKSVRLSFRPLPTLNEHLELIASTNGNDYVYIYDGADTNGNLIGVYTGSTINYPQPGTFISSSSCITIKFESDNADVSQGWNARAYCSDRPTVQLTNSDVGCTVCAPVVFTDTGGSGAGYGNNESYIQTYCTHATAASGTVVWADFTSGSIGIEQNWDYLYVFDGASTSDRCIGIYTGNSSNINNLGIIKATEDNSSGCLTFQFFSDGATVASGWSALMTAGLPRKSFGEDECSDATLISQVDVPYAGSTVLATGKPNTNDSDLNIALAALAECSGVNAITRLESTVWYKFSTPSDVCTASEVNLILNNISCQNEIAGGSGIQFVLYETASCLSGAAWGDPIYCADKLINGDQVNVKDYISPGLDYYVMIDGFTGQHCNFDLTMSLVGGTSSDCILPIELLSFEGENRGEYNHLFWSTASESNNAGFYVQRASGNNYDELGFENISELIPSLSISGSGANYNYDDFNYKKGMVNYYRLLQMDFDGTEHYHRIIQINNPDDSETHEIYPNPISDFIYIKIENAKDEQYNILIYDSSGQLVKEKTIQGEGNIIETEMSLSNLATGMYWYKIESNSNIYSGKIIKK